MYHFQRMFGLELIRAIKKGVGTVCTMNIIKPVNTRKDQRGRKTRRREKKAKTKKIQKKMKNEKKDYFYSASVQDPDTRC